MLKNILKTNFSCHVQAISHTRDTLRRKPFTHLLTITVIALALALPALLWVFVNNLSYLAHDWQSGGHISLYLKPHTSEKEVQSILQTVKANPSIKDLIVRSPEQGMGELSAQEGMANIMRHLPDNPLPWAVEIIPVASIDSPEKMNQLYESLQKLPGLEQASLDRDWVKRLHALFTFAAKVALALTILLAIAVLFIVGNMLRLAIHQRQEEIQVLKMIGATDAYIIRPFLYQGLWYGLGGAVLACMLVTVFIFCLENAVNTLASAYKISYSITGLSVSQILQLFMFAGILGWLGASLSVRRQLAGILPH